MRAGQRFAEEYREVVRKLQLTSKNFNRELQDIKDQITELSAASIGDECKPSGISNPTERTALRLIDARECIDIRYSAKLKLLNEKKAWFDEIIDRANFKTDEQEVFTLRYSGEWRLWYKEIAEQTDWSERTVHRLMDVCYEKIEEVIE